MTRSVGSARPPLAARSPAAVDASQETFREPFWLANRLALSVEEAARAIGVSDTHLRKVLLREIPHIRLGRRIVIPKHGLERFLAERSEAERGRADEITDEILDALNPESNE